MNHLEHLMKATTSPQPFRNLRDLSPRRQWDRALHIFNYLSAWICCGADRYIADGDWKILMRPKLIPQGSPNLLFVYGDVAEAIGDSRNAGRTLSEPLGILAKFCAHNEVPLINTLVVNAETGIPGHGVITDGTKSLGDQQREALEFDWLNYRSPTTRTLKAIQESDW